MKEPASAGLQDIYREVLHLLQPTYASNVLCPNPLIKTTPAKSLHRLFRKMSSSRSLLQWAAQASRSFAASSGGPERKVAVLGAAGGIGQPLSLLLKVVCTDLGPYMDSGKKVDLLLMTLRSGLPPACSSTPRYPSLLSTISLAPQALPQMSATATPRRKSRSEALPCVKALLCSWAAPDAVCATHRVQGYDQDKLAEAVRGCDLVIIPAGVPRKPGMTRDDLFKVWFCFLSRTGRYAEIG
jgi:hypothetical protein